MIELLRKEFRAQRPMALLILSFFAGLLVYELASGFPDMPEWEEGQVEGALVLALLFGTMTGASLLVGESIEGTLSFLDGLPMPRSRVYLAKISAGLAVLGILPVLDLVLSFCFWASARQSTDGPFPWADASVAVFLQGLVNLYVLSVSVALSFARQWFALVVGFVFWGFLWLRLREVPWIGLFDPHEMMSATGEGDRALVPWRHAVAVTTVSLACLGIAWMGFLALGDRARHAADRLSRGRLGAALRLCGIALIPVVWIAALYNLGRLSGADAEDSDDRPLGETAFARHETKRYEFVFRESQRERALRLARKADAAHDKVARFMGAAPVPARIVVDLGSPVMEHAAGQANWTKIRICMEKADAAKDLVAVLGHETAHVYINHLSDGELMRHFESARFFHEGLATYIEHRFFAGENDRLTMRRLAAAAHARGRVPFAALADNGALGKARDGNLAYPLGEVFCEALVATHGDLAPGALCRAFARPRASVAPKGERLWRDAMQACGFDLDRVVAAYDTALDRAVIKERPFIETIPRLTARVEVAGGRIAIWPRYDGRAPGAIVCMVPDTVGESILVADADGAIRMPRSKSPGPAVRYALGWRTPELPWPLFEPWTEAAVSP